MRLIYSCTYWFLGKLIMRLFRRGDYWILMPADQRMEQFLSHRTSRAQLNTNILTRNKRRSEKLFSTWWWNVLCPFIWWRKKHSDTWCRPQTANISMGTGLFAVSVPWLIGASTLCCGCSGTGPINNTPWLALKKSASCFTFLELFFLTCSSVLGKFFSWSCTLVLVSMLCI